MKKANYVICLVFFALIGCSSNPENKTNINQQRGIDSNSKKRKLDIVAKEKTSHDTNCKYAIKIDTILNKGQGQIWNGSLVIYFMEINADSVTIYLNGTFYKRKYHVYGHADNDAPYVIEIPNSTNIKNIGIQINDGRLAAFPITKKRKSVGVYYYYYKEGILNILFYDGRLEFG